MYRKYLFLKEFTKSQYIVCFEVTIITDFLIQKQTAACLENRDAPITIGRILADTD